MVMANPLTLDERIAVVGLINHDLMNSLDTSSGAATGRSSLSSEDAYQFNRHARHVLTTITIMSTYADSCGFRREEPLGFNLAGMELLTVNNYYDGKGRLSFSNEFDEPLMTSIHPVYTVLHQLAKNALRINKDGKVGISITPFVGGIRNPVYMPPESERSGGFVKFSVHDDGPGFPTDRPLKDFLEDGVSTRGRFSGFGLYFVKLAAKFLRAPIEIESKPGDTRVSLYHPVNLR